MRLFDLPDDCLIDQDKGSKKLRTWLYDSVMQLGDVLKYRIYSQII